MAQVYSFGKLDVSSINDHDDPDENIEDIKNNDSACGGYYRKSLTLFMGQPNVGKSLIMCSEAALTNLKNNSTNYFWEIKQE
ncbi:MAG: hypothetical protein M0Q13_14400 [Methanothrix sp.]|jgi:ribosome biogenesis GTPase A|nr:hypothetical protein [Methanothrix sp.]